MEWSEEELEFLKKNYKKMTHKEIATRIGKSESAVRNKCYNLKYRKAKPNWTKDEENLLKKYYLKASGDNPISLKELSIVFKRDKSNICRKARELGMDTNTNRKCDDETLKIMRKNTLKQLKEKGHPRGMLGKHHSKEFKEKMSKRVKKEWSKPDSIFKSEKVKRLKSDAMSKSQVEGKLRNNYSRGKQGKRKDLKNQYFRSSWEANYARYLNFMIIKGDIYKWEYEKDTFYFNEIKIGIRTYTPDFKIWVKSDSIPYYVEVKGWMDEKSKIKLDRMKKYYPDITIKLIESKEYKKISEAYRIIENWE